MFLKEKNRNGIFNEKKKNQSKKLKIYPYFSSINFYYFFFFVCALYSKTTKQSVKNITCTDSDVMLFREKPNRFFFFFPLEKCDLLLTTNQRK